MTRGDATTESAFRRSWHRLDAYGDRIRHFDTKDDRERIAAALFPDADPEHTETWRARFSILTGASIVIATMGLVADSAAVVIGAMLIAPLMRPVLGFAAAVLLGWPRRTASAAATVVAATVAAIALSWLLSALYPSDGLGTEVLSRTSPDISDLFVALAAGVAGAYATLREDISGALPGVAVAVALVPPLAVIGVALQAGRGDLAAGAGLLYGANLVAIAVSAGVVFVASGFIPAPHRSRNGPGAGIGVMTTIVVLGVSVPLVIATVDVARNAQRTEAVNVAVSTWLEGSDLEVERVDVDDEVVTVTVSGVDEPPDAELLAPNLISTLGREVDVAVRWRQVRGATGDDGDDGDGERDLEVIEAAVREWLGEADFDLSGIAVNEDGTVVTVSLSGPESPPDVGTLADALSEQAGTTVTVEVQWTQRRNFTSTDTDTTETDLEIVTELAAEWAEPLGLTVVEVRIVRDGVDRIAIIDVTGRTEPADAADLAAELTDRYADSLELDVRWYPYQSIPITTTTTTTTTTPPPTEEPPG